MTSKKNYRNLAELLLAYGAGTQGVDTKDAQEILKRLRFKDESSRAERIKKIRHEDSHGRTYMYRHPSLPDLIVNLSKDATLSWGDKAAFSEAIRSLLAVEPDALERLEPGYAVRIANAGAEEQFRQ